MQELAGVIPWPVLLHEEALVLSRLGWLPGYPNISRSKGGEGIQYEK